MTITHQLVGVGSIANDTVMASKAARLGRIAPTADREYFGIVSCSPFVIPWTETTDINGELYPDGLVGVCNFYIDEIMDETGAYTTLLDDYFSSHCIAVPGELPIGYTARYERDLYDASGFVFGGGDPLSVSTNTASYYRSPTGLIYTDWVPEYNSRGVGGQFNDLYIHPSGDSILYRTDSPIIGYRYLKYVIVLESLATASTISGSLTVEISHNADGSEASIDNGDTIDDTQSLGSGDFTITGSPGAWVYTSSQINAGELIPTLGIRSRFYLKISGLNSFLPFPEYASPQLFVNLLAGPNLTVPFTFTCTGEGGLIAPGGIV